jgi:hypothetical protein
VQHFGNKVLSVHIFVNMCRLCLQADAPDAGGLTPLHFAAVALEEGAVLRLLAGCACSPRKWFTTAAHDGMTPAHFAARCGRGSLNARMLALAQEEGQVCTCPASCLLPCVSHPYTPSMPLVNSHPSAHSWSMSQAGELDACQPMLIMDTGKWWRRASCRQWDPQGAAAPAATPVHAAAAASAAVRPRPATLAEGVPRLAVPPMVRSRVPAARMRRTEPLGGAGDAAVRQCAQQTRRRLCAARLVWMRQLLSASGFSSEEIGGS